MKRIRHFVKDTQGSMVVIMAFLLFIAVALLAIIMDVGHLHAVKNELANAADAASLAGARALFPLDNYPGLAPAYDPPFCFIQGGAVDTAIETSSLNKTDGDLSIQVAETDVVLGWWSWDTNGPFTAKPGICSLDEINAIRVTTRRREWD